MKDTIITFSSVEHGLVTAMDRLGHELGYGLRGVLLIHQPYADKAAPEERDPSGTFEQTVCDFDDPDDIQRVIAPLNKRLLTVTARFEGDMQYFKKLVPFVPYIATPTESSIDWATKKPLMRDRLSAYNPSLSPRYQVVRPDDLGRIDRLLAGFSYPVIVKPGELVASILVSQCNSFDSTKETLDKTFAALEKTYRRYHRHTASSVLVEEMMQGDMYSIDAYVSSTGEVSCLPLVQVITANSIGLPGFYSYRHIIPVSLNQDMIEAANTTAKKAVYALNLRATTAHIEMFLTADGWKIIELGARMGGYRYDLYKEAYGIDHYYNDIANRIGHMFELPTQLLHAAGGFNIYAEQEGRILSINGVEEARRLPSVVKIETHAAPGDQALFAGNGGDLVVDGILRHDDPAQLERDMREVRRLVTIQVEQPARKEYAMF